MKKRFAIAGLAATALLAIPVAASATMQSEAPADTTPCGVDWPDMTQYMSEVDSDWSAMRSFVDQPGMNLGQHMSSETGMMGFGPARIPGS